MKPDWHERIQRYADGESTEEQANVLQQALKDDAGLRALYLDYINLEVAIGAAAEAAALTGNDIAGMAASPGPFAGSRSRSWHWVAAAGACAAAVVLTTFPRHHDAPRGRHDFDATISSTENAIARLSFEPASSLPGWMSPTASMLQLPEISK